MSLEFNRLGVCATAHRAEARASHFRLAGWFAAVFMACDPWPRFGAEWSILF